jgi:hypothetical protein
MHRMAYTALGSVKHTHTHAHVHACKPYRHSQLCNSFCCDGDMILGRHNTKVYHCRRRCIWRDICGTSIVGCSLHTNVSAQSYLSSFRTCSMSLPQFEVQCVRARMCVFILEVCNIRFFSTMDVCTGHGCTRRAMHIQHGCTYGIVKS